MTAPLPLLNGQLIGIAYHAIAAVRDRLLAASGLTFHQSVALNAAADGLDRATAVTRMVATLKIDAAEGHALLDELTAAGLIDGDPVSPADKPSPTDKLPLTDEGDRIHRGFREAVAALADRLYGGLSTAERELAARALAHVTARANAELAALDDVTQPASR
ncbi:hypothetical protein DEJ44_00835 [Streptomyces venezuelae]|uniref:winged helix DNA-binding protein n=1 Tax=Streptomyces venezuelae TaxID=54571 RepID=UPI00123BB0FA|nr:winged helix DNA-binding protein [Streptomyces venezuelae]QES04287.1 hypothetical protein DEJ44_00835 [Streptomyces venezuelae]